MKSINFSRFNKLCKFYTKLIIPDGLGGHIVQWQEVYQAWGQITTILPDRKSQGTKPSHPWTHRMYARYSGMIKPYMKLVYNDQPYVVDKVVNIDEQNQFIEAMLIRAGS